MSGTTAGGQKAASKIKQRDPDFYKRIGSTGGKKKGPKGFAVSGLASEAGRKGGLKSKRPKGAAKTWDKDEANWTSTSSASRTRQTVTPSQKSSEASSGGDLDRRTSSSLGSKLKRALGAWG